jgi:hypothetical protein
MIKRILLPFALLIAISTSVSAQTSSDNLSTQSGNGKNSYFQHGLRLSFLNPLSSASLVYEYRPAAKWGVEAGAGYVWNEKADPYYYLQAKYDPYADKEQFPFGARKYDYHASGPIEKLGLKFYPHYGSSYFGLMLSAEQAAQPKAIDFYIGTSSQAGGGNQLTHKDTRIQAYETALVWGYKIRPLNTEFCFGAGWELVKQQYTEMYSDSYPTANGWHTDSGTISGKKEQTAYPVLYVSLRMGIAWHKVTVQK